MPRKETHDHRGKRRALRIAPRGRDMPAEHVDRHRDEQDQPSGGEFLQIDLGRLVGRLQADAGDRRRAAKSRTPWSNDQVAHRVAARRCCASPASRVTRRIADRATERRRRRTRRAARRRPGRSSEVRRGCAGAAPCTCRSRATTEVTAPPREPDAYTPPTTPEQGDQADQPPRRTAEASSQNANGIASTTPAARKFGWPLKPICRLPTFGTAG